MSNVSVMYQNFLDTATKSASSEQTLFPASNLYLSGRRAKVWRSNGNWVIPASCSILFNAGAGDLTATIAAGTYTTAALATAIATAFNAVSSGYTAAWSSTTFKWTITKSSGTSTLKWTSGTSAVAAGILGFSTAVDSSGSLAYTASSIRIHTEEWLKWDLGSSFNPKALVLIGKKNLPIQLSTTATLTLQGNATDVWTSPSYSAPVSYDDTGIISIGATGLHTSALRYWRLVINDIANTNGYVELGMAYLGDTISPTRGKLQFPLESQVIDRTTTVMSDGGVNFAVQRQKAEQFNLRWFGLTIAEKEQLDTFFNYVGLGNPFFMSLDPNAAYGSTVGRHVRLVRFESVPTRRLESPSNFSMSWVIREDT